MDQPLSEIIKITFLGIPGSGRTSAYHSLVEMGYLQPLPSNEPLEILDATYHTQIARIAPHLFKENPELEIFNDKVFLFQWYQSATMHTRLVTELLLRDTQGILFFSNPTPGKLDENLKKWKLMLQCFSLYNDCTIGEFPLVICYNFADVFGEKLSVRKNPKGEDHLEGEEDSPPPEGLEQNATLKMPEIDEEGEVQERPATSTEARYLFGYNEKLNPQERPSFVTCASQGYNLWTAFGRLALEIVESGYLKQF